MEKKTGNYHVVGDEAIRIKPLVYTQCLVQSDKVIHASDGCYYSFTIKHKLLNPTLRSQGNRKQQMVWEGGSIGIRDLFDGDNLWSEDSGQWSKREMMAPLPMVKAKMGPWWEWIRNMEHTLLATGLLCLALITVPTHDLTPKTCHLTRTLLLCQESGGRVWDGFPTLTTFHRTNTPAQVWVSEKTRNWEESFPKACNYLFLNLSSFIPPPLKNLLFRFHISNNSRLFQKLLTRPGIHSVLWKGGELESQGCGIGSCQRDDRISTLWGEGESRLFLCWCISLGGATPAAGQMAANGTRNNWMELKSSESSRGSGWAWSKSEAVTNGEMSQHRKK